MTTPRVAVATVVARNYLSYARVLARSLRTHHPGVPFLVAVADHPDPAGQLEGEPFDVVALESLGIPDLRRVCFRCSCQELAVLVKPFLLRHVLDRGLNGIFLDPDILIVGDLTPLFVEVSRHALVLTPHLLQPLEGHGAIDRELNLLLAGTFNAGCVGVSDKPAAREALAWWQDRLLAESSHAVARGVYYDQRWLDLMPVLFDEVRIMRDVGCNIAYWNMPERRVQVLPDGIRVNGAPARFFHFSGFDPEHPEGPSRYSRWQWNAACGDARALYARYAELLLAAGHADTRRVRYGFDYFDNGTRISARARDLYKDLRGAVGEFGDPFRTGGTHSYFGWLSEHQPEAVAD